MGPTTLLFLVIELCLQEKKHNKGLLYRGQDPENGDETRVFDKKRVD